MEMLAGTRNDGANNNLLETNKCRSLKNYHLPKSSFFPIYGIKLVLPGNNIRTLDRIEPPNKRDDRLVVELLLERPAVPNTHAYIHCSQNDVDWLKQGVGLSLREEQPSPQPSFVPFPEKAVFEYPDVHNKAYKEHIDHIIIGFEQGVWRIKLEREHSLRGEIRFNAKKDVINFGKWLNDLVY